MDGKLEEKGQIDDMLEEKESMYLFFRNAQLVLLAALTSPPLR